MAFYTKTVDVMANLHCQLDYIWSHLKHKLVDTPVSERFSWSDYLKQQDPPLMWVVSSGGSPGERTWEKETGFCLLALTLASKFICATTVVFILIWWNKLLWDSNVDRRPAALQESSRPSVSD